MNNFSEKKNNFLILKNINSSNPLVISREKLLEIINDIP